jgi:hypothetical protein
VEGDDQDVPRPGINWTSDDLLFRRSRAIDVMGPVDEPNFCARLSRLLHIPDQAV